MLNVGLASNSIIRMIFSYWLLWNEILLQIEKKCTTPTKIYLQFSEINRQDMQGHTEPVYDFE